MLINISLTVLAMLPSLAWSTTLPDKVDWSKHQYRKPGTGDVRGPCPGLNTLANHGFLPRNGQDISPSTVIKAALDGYNLQSKLGVELPARLALLTTTSLGTFSLMDISMHNTIEADASISRGDFALGDNHSFNETLFKTLAQSNPGVDYYNTSSAGEVQRLRLLHSQAVNPNITNTNKELIFRSGASALYLSVMGNITTKRAPKKFVDVLFREERLPIAEGWKRSSIQIDDAVIQDFTTTIAGASKWAPDGKDPSIDILVADNQIFRI